MISHARGAVVFVNPVFVGGRPGARRGAAAERRGLAPGVWPLQIRCSLGRRGKHQLRGGCRGEGKWGRGFECCIKGLQP